MTRRAPRRSTRERAFGLSALATLLLGGCGDGSPGKDPVQPGPVEPASVTISAGDGQQAPGGTAVSIAPAVRVRDAEGGPVSGVAVTFEVVDGGGTVSGAVPTTNSSGIAAVEGWTLGPDGPQRLRASVAGLSPVEFEASIPAGSEQIEGSVPIGGGTIVITKEGHPFEGLELTIPEGSYDREAVFRFRAGDAPSGLDLPEGYAIRGRVLEIQTDLSRSGELMTLEVPVDRQPDEDVVLALYHPGSGAIEVMPTVDRTETSVTVVTTHLDPNLLLGTTASALGGPARQVSIGPAVLLPIAQLTPVAPARVPLNAWPVLDHGSAAFPDGHGAAIAALQAVAPSVLAEPFAEIVRELDTPGFYAEPGPLAVVQMAHQRLTSEMQVTVGRMAEMLAAMPKPERDELLVRNIVAGLALGARSMPLAVRNGNGSFWFMSAVEGSETGLQLRPTTSVPELEMVRNILTGLQSIEFPEVAGGPMAQADQVIPVTSFLGQLESLRDLLDDLRRLTPSTPPEVRDALNTALANEAGLPVVELLQNPAGEGWLPVKSDEIVVRTQALTIRLGGVLGGSVAFTLHLPTGAEVARAEGDEEIPVGSLPEVAELEPMVPVPHTVSLFEEISGALKQIVPATRNILLAQFEVDPEEVELSSTSETVELEATVPYAPPEGFRIHWDWGDEDVSEGAELVSVSHTYDDVGEYPVIATLQSADGQQALAVDTARVQIGAEKWVGTATYRMEQLAGPFLRTVETAGLEFTETFSGNEGVRVFSLAKGTAVGRILTESGSGCPYDSGPITREMFQGEGLIQTIEDYETEEGDEPPPLVYQATGDFEPPLQIPITDTCDSGNTWTYLTYAWLRTPKDGDVLAWIEASDPNLLEGVRSEVRDNIRYTWEWRFERVLW